MIKEPNPYDLSDKAWAIIEPLTIGNKGSWGGNAHDTRLFINGVFWVLRTGSPWRDLPDAYGDWKNTHRRFCRWRDKRIWERILQALMEEPDFEWLMVEATPVRAQAQAVESGEPDSETHGDTLPPRYIWPWMRLICQYDSLLQRMPQRIHQLQHYC